MKIDRPQHPAELRRTDLRKKASPPTTPADNTNEFASFSAQLAARSQRFRAGGAAAPRLDTEEATPPFPAFLPVSRRTLGLGAGGIAVLLLSGALIVWGSPFHSSRPPSSNRIEQAKADVPSAATPEALEAKAAPPAPALPAAAPADPPASPPQPPRQDIVKSNLDVAPSSPQMPPTAQATVQVTAQAAVAPPLTREEIRDLQGRLKAAGFDPGSVDGAMGAQTRGAVRKYADARALPNAEARELLARLKGEAPPVPSASAAAAAAPPSTDRAAMDPARDWSASSLSADEIRDLQDKLKAAGFNPGATDGIVGRQTLSAVREYAGARALPTADLTKQLLARLKAESASATPDNAASLTPDEIRDLQTRLKVAGFNPGAADGAMGRQTRSALREYADARALASADTRELLSRLKAETP